MDKVGIVGVGMTPFGKFPEADYLSLGRNACLAAIKDAGISPREIDAAYCGNGLASRLFGAFTIGQSIFWEIGLKGIPVINVENACTSGSTAFYQACLAIYSGLYDKILVLGTEKMFGAQIGMLSSGNAEIEPELGFYVPVSFALRAKAHMQEYGTTKEQLAMVTVKNRRHGQLNPLAQYRDPITLDDVLNSPVIAEPLTRLSCCPIGDGAAAIIICRESLVPGLTSNPVWVRASILGSGYYDNPPDLARWKTDFETAYKAYEQAGCGPDDIDVAEVHDAFTIAEIMHYEGLGFCKEGEGGILIERGETALGGRIPVNPSGGLLSRGHPVGATGVAQLVELTWQLRGQCGKRQVEGAKAGLAHCMGGDKHGDTKSITIHILTN